MRMIENFEGYLLDLNVIMIYLGFYSEEDYIYDDRTDLINDKNIMYTDKRNDSNHLLIEFEVLEDWSECASPYIKVTNIFNN